jgi:hypothetical protein
MALILNNGGAILAMGSNSLTITNSSGQAGTAVLTAGHVTMAGGTISTTGGISVVGADIIGRGTLDGAGRCPEQASCGRAAGATPGRCDRAPQPRSRRPRRRRVGVRKPAETPRRSTALFQCRRLLLEALDLVHDIRELQDRREGRGILLWPWSRMTGWRAVRVVMVARWAGRASRPQRSVGPWRRGRGPSPILRPAPLCLCCG